MSITWSDVSYSRISITFLVAMCAMVLPSTWFSEHIVLIAFFLILLGVPHGAGDYWIFAYLTKQLASKTRQFRFVMYYFGVLAIYGLIWWIAPFAAFLIFLGISVFHFGQSNWNYLADYNRYISVFTYLLWGIAILGVPILIYHQEASLIIKEITGTHINLDSIWRFYIIYGLIIINIIHIALMFFYGAISRTLFLKELAGFVTLMTLFFTTPLLIGFGFYFVFWHSVDAMYDQINILRLDNKYAIRPFLYQVAALSFLSFVGLGLLYLLVGRNMNYGLNMGVLFLFISMITVPHSILMDRLYYSAINKTMNL
ncbi:MAG: beta-carotene 15,15'-dioxygenase, Brp/Blh family [Saprospiraceae bacterium]|nr:beta-carotene 15,15'-dioxygenase, Brp/Blh family [Saprospiraceae bacterium]